MEKNEGKGEKKEGRDTERERERGFAREKREWRRSRAARASGRTIFILA